MPKRLFKQVVYVASFAAVVIGIVSVILYFVLKQPPSCFDKKLNQGETEVDCGGPCVSCDLRHLKPLQVSGVTLFDSGQGAVSTLVEVRNLNPNYGADHFSYTIDFYDKFSKKIFSYDGESFVYPGRIKKLVDTGIAIGLQDIGRAELTIDTSSLSWRPVIEFIPAKTDIRELDIGIDSATQNVVISGLAINNNAYAVPEINVVAIIYNKRDVPINIAKTLLKDFPPFHERSFQISIPVVDVSNFNRESTDIFLEASPQQ